MCIRDRRYKDHELVNTIIHETMHLELFIPSNADFNERMAVFVGNVGTEMFYRDKEGESSATLRLIEEENFDDKIFSDFISEEIRVIEKWYKELPESERSEDRRKERLRQIQQKFLAEIRPKLRTKNYDKFPNLELNNARLVMYKTYYKDLSEFEKLYKKTNSNFHLFLAELRKLRNSKNPVHDLKKLTENPVTPQ
ncbi:MAG: aminopeptidase, partial [Bdellovibrionaceae bacterium]|nr:aminopeptidase [Pseudobdellovibrionaceae bacterium]